MDKVLILNLKRKLLQKIKKRISRGHHTLEIVHPDKEVLNGIASNNYLAAYTSNIASQGGEDGVIQKIIETVGLKSPGWCVEFGACDGKLDSNTWNLVQHQGWKAVYIESDPNFFPLLKKYCDETPGTYCFDDMVGWEGENRLDAILARTPIPAEFDFLSIDVDGPDYHLWDALQNYRPHIVSIEFNRLISPKVSYFPEKGGTSRPSSLLALYELGKRKGYELVCVVNWNALFVRKEHFPKFAIKDNHPDKLFYAEAELRIFQGYDGTLVLHPGGRHFWKSQRSEDGVINPIMISQSDIQVLPDGLRIFRPRHTYRCLTLEKQAGQLDIKKVPKNVLLEHRRNVTSENGEDGILEHIFKKLGVTNGFCVDIGATDGKKWSNSWNVIVNHSWRGLLIESDKENFAQLITNYKDNNRVQCVLTKVRSHSLEGLLSAHKVPKKFDLLTMDIEGNEYHLFAALKHYQPSVVVIDFNPSIGNDIRFVQKNSDRAHYGASLVSLTELATKKGYSLAAVTDWNAIFVRKDIFPLLNMPASTIDEMYYPPFEMRMFQSLDGCMHLPWCHTLVRQDYTIEWEDFQVLPQQLRGHVNSSRYFDSLSELRKSVDYKTRASVFGLRTTFYE